MDAKFLLLTGMLFTGGFGATWVALTPSAPVSAFAVAPAPIHKAASTSSDRPSGPARIERPYGDESPEPASFLPDRYISEPTAPVARASDLSVYYRNCAAARAAGAAPIYRGEPGYRPEMDGDSDGIACEPYRGR